MRDEIGRAIAGALAHRLDDAGLGHATQVVLDRGPPARFDEIEAGGLCQPFGLGHAAVETVLRDAIPRIGVGPLVKRVDPETDAMGEQRQAAGIVETVDPVPEPVVIASGMSPRQASARSSIIFAAALSASPVASVGR